MLTDAKAHWKFNKPSKGQDHEQMAIKLAIKHHEKVRQVFSTFHVSLRDLNTWICMHACMHVCMHACLA